ncbi:hypothetical protein JXA84_01590 [candidate division WOR-3 bacterium]|nr:hypothetical protein [candidate division WOR-3 bacterium]
MRIQTAYYISSHGFGHITRSFEIIKKFSSFDTRVVCGYPFEIAKNFGYCDIGAKSYTEQCTDIGVAQKDALEMDLEKTLKENFAYISEYEKLVQRELDFISKNKIEAVFSDVSPVPISAARKLGIPGYIVGNFTWDWIYGGFARVDSKYSTLEKFYRKKYSETDVVFELPFSGGLDNFKKKIRTGLVGRRPLLSNPVEAKEHLGVEKGRKTVVFAFGGFNVFSDFKNRGDAYTVLIPGFEDKFITKNVRMISTHIHRLPDVLLASDCVVTKPGYGIVSELTFLKMLGFEKRTIYCDRGPFREYDVLKKAIERYFTRSTFIDSGKIKNGEWIKSV